MGGSIWDIVRSRNSTCLLRQLGFMVCPELSWGWFMVVFYDVQHYMVSYRGLLARGGEGGTPILEHGREVPL